MAQLGNTNIYGNLTVTGTTKSSGNFIGNITGNATTANTADTSKYVTVYSDTVYTDRCSILFTAAVTGAEKRMVELNPNIYVIPSAGSLTANAVYGAVWNDLADSISLGEGDTVEPGYCYCFDGEHYTKTSKYMQQSYIGIHSDTYGFRMGFEKEKEKLDVAVSGFALAYVDKEYPVGTPLTCTKNGYLTEISKEDKRNNPEMVIAKYWKSEPNEEWGIDNRKVKVNGRKWVKIK